MGLAGASQAAPGPDAPLSTAERSLIVEAIAGDPDGAPADRSDAALWAALIRHATLELGLRVRPAEVDAMWALAPRPRQVEAEAQAARAGGRLGAWLASLPPAAPRYQALLEVRARYRRIVAAGGWSPTPREAGGRTPDPAATAALRARLTAEGYLTPAQVGDAELKRAVMAFQAHHALAPDGALGPQTLAALNVTAEARLAQVEANLERWRWLPPLPATRIEVDAGGAEAALFVRDAPQLSMRTIVGDRDHKTPMFASRLESVVFNPPWNVPASIAAKELLPKERAHPGYLARNDFIFVDGALQQKPGPLNALGRIKFDFPSPFGVYLHDTPARAAFGQANRWRSHGCVRLENPRGLAIAVLGPQGWTPERVDAAIAAGATSRVQLAQTIPLYVAYWTVVIAPDGAPVFRPDPYGWDEALLRALARGGAGGGGKVTQIDSECRGARVTKGLL